MVVSNILYFHPYLGEWSNLTNIFQRGWNHQQGINIVIIVESNFFCLRGSSISKLCEAFSRLQFDRQFGLQTKTKATAFSLHNLLFVFGFWIQLFQIVMNCTPKEKSKTKSCEEYIWYKPIVLCKMFLPQNYVWFNPPNRFSRLIIAWIS